MILTPATAPPPLHPTLLERSPGANNTSQTLLLSSAAGPSNTTIMNTPPQTEEHAEEEEKGFIQKLNVPTVVLDTPAVSHTMAAALALALLGHTLFLKNQVPFPVAQLARMPGGRSNPKVAKKRDELLATFDLLTSHLHTTFMALSTAYAKCKLAKTQDSSPANGENAPPEPQGVHQGRLRTAHLMFVLGPSAHAAKARIILTIDGLEVKVWGARVAEEVDSDEESEEDSESDCSEEEDVSDENSEGETGSDDEEESGEDASDSESSGPGSGPPSSRSPSPCSPSTRSLAPSPESLPSPRVLPTPLPSQSGFVVPAVPLSSQPASQGCVVQQSTPPPLPAPKSGPAPSQQTLASCDTAPISPTLVPELSYADEQKALRAAERLLSRTLMNAWVNNADAGTENNHELAPTQTHIFLLAPRRFVHPAWIARQNLTRTLDTALTTFLQEAGAVPLPPAPAKSKPKVSSMWKGVRTEGAWITCGSGSAFEKARESVKQEGQDGGASGGMDEDDEEIWWAWDGKIVGFADW